MTLYILGYILGAAMCGAVLHGIGSLFMEYLRSRQPKLYHIETTMKKSTLDLKKGDMVDLASDSYYSDAYAAKHFWHWVESVEVETYTCALVTFIDSEGDQSCCGFPLNHQFIIINKG